MSRYVIHVTKACNMDCSYCYEHDKESGHTSIDEIRRLIDLIPMNECDSIEFIGGEPLLNVEAIRFSCEYIWSMRKVAFRITTNGTVINDDIIDLINKYKIKLYISVDGTRFMHDCCRHFKETMHGTHLIVMRNIEKFSSVLHEKPCAQLTAHRHNVGYLFDGIEYLYSHGIRDINIGVVKHNADDNFYRIYIEQHRKMIDAIDDMQMPGIRITPMMESDEYGRAHVQHCIVPNKHGSSMLETYSYNDDTDLKYTGALNYVQDLYLKGEHKNEDHNRI